MTRIVLDPGELKRAAGFIAEASTAYSDIAASLRQREIPEMPPTLAEAVAAGVQRAAQRLDSLSARLDASALLLRTRAAVVDADGSADVLLRLGRDLDR